MPVVPKETRSDGLPNSWYGLTPEQRQRRLDRTAETRRLRKVAEAERARCAAEQVQRRLKARERARQRRQLDAVVMAVPGSGKQEHEFEAVAPRYLDRRALRFWPFVDSSGGPDACWPWHGPRRFDSDYGNASWHGDVMPSHRVAWMLNSGLQIPSLLVVDHLCECKWCQSPRHLEVVTRGENNRRIHRRTPEQTRTRTSFAAPWDDRWYPFGRRLHDEDGRRYGEAE